MFDEPRARELAEADSKRNADIGLGRAREIQFGWFFPWTNPPTGSHGVVVNKRTGGLLHVGFASLLERDLAMYDRGYQFLLYDLVILVIHNLEATRRVVCQLPVSIVEPSYEHGQVWRIARPLTRQERWKRLESLPCVLPAVHLYFCLELLEEARREGWFEFKALEYRPTPRVHDDA